jgi:hypothetical protein
MVPIERTLIPFIRKQSIAVGKSEHIRIKHARSGFGKKIVEELFKWGVSKALFFFYLFTFRPAKGIMLLKFRYWVFLGLRGKE